MKASFTDQEKTLLKGHKASIARKHKCSTMYVGLIIEGQREINSDLAKKIHSDLKQLAEFLTPQTEE